MPDLELYKDAILTVDMPGEALRAGDVGRVVERHQVPGVKDVGYCVEFLDMTGRTVAVVTVPASNLRADVCRLAQCEGGDKIVWLTIR